MARAFSLVSDFLFPALQRRGYAGVSILHVRLASRIGKLEDKSAVAAASATKQDSPKASSAWVPDPVTGYYRPGNYSPEIDPAELRLMLLNHKVTPTTNSA